ncbi:hypothetical protein B0H14DRAFT_2643134 [Mycena olivaceomarginata]|nr:hypothetical protein B0H14DRAFT_2643134 [Mycena olivaceomarginata]
MWRYANVIINKLVPLTNFHFVLTRRAPASAYIEAAWLEFSTFNLAVCRAISPPVHFDAGECLMQRLLEEPRDEDEAVTEPQPFWVAPLSHAPSSPAPSSHLARARRRRHRAQAFQPRVARERCRGQRRLRVPRAASPHDLETGLGGVRYTQEEVDALTGTQGFMYISWLGRLTIPLLDAQRRVIAVLGGTPRDHAGWKTVTDGAAALLEERQPRIKLTQEALHHRRAQDAFPAIARGVAHGGGRMEPGEVHQNVANTLLTDELRAHDYIQRIMSFASSLILLWAPLLNAFYLVNKTLLSAWKPSMRWHVNTLFAACTFNFGPRAITAPHLDFANLAWGWCSVTALGNFDPDFGGHLILWDLCLVIRFPPPARRSLSPPPWYGNPTSPSARTSSARPSRSTPRGASSAFQSSASTEEKAVRAAEDAQRWEEGVKMFSVVDEL